MAGKKQTGIPASQALGLASLVDYGEGSIVSRILVKGKAGSLTLFAFDAGQNLSEHTTPFDALVQVVEGQAEVTIDGQSIKVKAGQLILMPANIPHAVDARERFKMLLSMIRE